MYRCMATTTKLNWCILFRPLLIFLLVWLILLFVRLLHQNAGNVAAPPPNHGEQNMNLVVSV